MRKSRRTTTFGGRAALAALLALAAAAPGGARAADPWGLPKELDGVGIEPRPGSQVPLDAVFRDEQGEVVRLGDYFDGERPVVLVLAYYRCPMLCGLVLESTVKTLKALEYSPGHEYRVLTVSIDQRETPELARQKKGNVLAEFNRPGAENGWHFLTGSEQHIAALAAAVGFKFRFMPERNDFAHSAGIFVLTTDGRVSQTITGLEYDARTVRLALVEAGEGKVGSVLDQVLLYCFHYDATTGRYTPVIMNILRLAGGVTVLALGALVGTLLLRERRQRRASAEATSPDTTPASMGTP